jgi:uncharacterized protein YjlB
MSHNIIILVVIWLLILKSDYAIRKEHINMEPEIIYKVMKDDGIFPNSKLPVILYKGVIDFHNGSQASVVENVFLNNGWGNSWRNGIYGFHHYHSTAHEVLGVYSGSAEVRLGGEKGATFHIEKGDVVLIPAGVAHKNLNSSSDFRVVGAYPEGQSWDMNYGKEGERPTADENIKNVPLPTLDPVFGKKGPVMEIWRSYPETGLH